ASLGDGLRLGRWWLQRTTFLKRQETKASQQPPLCGPGRNFALRHTREGLLHRVHHEETRARTPPEDASAPEQDFHEGSTERGRCQEGSEYLRQGGTDRPRGGGSGDSEKILSSGNC